MTKQIRNPIVVNNTDLHVNRLVVLYAAEISHAKSLGHVDTIVFDQMKITCYGVARQVLLMSDDDAKINYVAEK